MLYRAIIKKWMLKNLKNGEITHPDRNRRGEAVYRRIITRTHEATIRRTTRILIVLFTVEKEENKVHVLCYCEQLPTRRLLTVRKEKQKATSYTKELLSFYDVSDVTLIDRIATTE